MLKEYGNLREKINIIVRTFFKNQYAYINTIYQYHFHHSKQVFLYSHEIVIPNCFFQSVFIQFLQNTQGIHKTQDGMAENKLREIYYFNIKH